MDIKFLDKVYSQILSETRIIDDKGLIHFPFILPYLRLNDNKDNFFFPLINQRLYSHCKEVYSLNEQEIDYVWTKYKEGVTTLINDKDISHQEKGWWSITHDHNDYCNNKNKMKDSTVLNNNPILKEIKNKYGEINQRLISESIRILKEEYSIEVGDIVLDKYNNMGVITGVEIFNLHSYLIKSNYEDVTFHVHSQRFNMNGSYNKNYHSLNIYSDLNNVKTVGNISTHKSDKDRRKLYKSLSLK